MDIVSIVSISTVVLGAVVWGVRQEGRITNQMTRVDDLKELINTRFDSLEKIQEAQTDGLDTRLKRIERAMNGSLGKESV